mmetsp:Transcript_24170/g.54305  ORF Transcript_24170/g.54305 Transcript_24170/m.54305 type:complete len:349 (+) Transcript_24170:604-1650(+)
MQRHAGLELLRDGLQQREQVQPCRHAPQPISQPLLLRPPGLQRFPLHARWASVQVLAGRSLAPPRLRALLFLPLLLPPQLYPVVLAAAGRLLAADLRHLPPPLRRPVPLHEVLLHGHHAERPIAVVRPGRVDHVPGGRLESVQGAGRQHASLHSLADPGDLHRPPPQHSHAIDGSAPGWFRPPHQLVGQRQRRYPWDFLGTVLQHFARFSPRLLANHSDLRLAPDQGMDSNPSRLPQILPHLLRPVPRLQPCLVYSRRCRPPAQRRSQHRPPAPPHPLRSASKMLPPLAAAPEDDAEIAESSLPRSDLRARQQAGHSPQRAVCLHAPVLGNADSPPRCFPFLPSHLHV